MKSFIELNEDDTQRFYEFLEIKKLLLKEYYIK